MPYKIFQDGDVLTATEVNEYMMEQQIGVYASSAVRATAIPTPVHGQMSFTKDDNKLAYFDGSTWRNL